jgi:hypothetical protein
MCRKKRDNNPTNEIAAAAAHSPAAASLIKAQAEA